MKNVLRGSAFIFGAVFGLVLIALLDDTFPWFWLPLLMGVAASVVVFSQPWFRATKLAPAYSASITAGTALTYSLSTHASSSSSRFGGKIPVVALAVGTILFLGCITRFLALGFSQKPTRAMTGWLLISVWSGCVVGYVSGGIGGANHMVHWLMAITHMAQDQAEVVIHYVRKTIHVCAYGIVGTSLFRSALAGKARQQNAIGFAMMMVFVIASFDELRQTTAPNRTGSAWDVALDMTGAFIFVMLSALLFRSTKNTKRP